MSTIDTVVNIFQSILMNYIFKNPDHSDVAIYDYNGSWKIKKLLNKQYTSTIIYTRGEKLNITPTILLCSIYYLFKIYGPRVIKQVYARPGVIKLVYYMALINVIKPKIVITNIDNDLNFHYLSNFFNIKFISIQNGCRSSQTLIAIANTKAQKNNHIYMCFGEYEKNMLVLNNSDMWNILPIGAIEPFLFMKELAKDYIEKYDICLVSEWDENQLYIPDFYLSMKQFHINLNKYRLNYKKNIIIAMRHKSDEEVKYYRGIFGDGISLVIRDDKSATTYRAIIESHIVVSVASTACLHALIMKKKILYFDYSDLKYCVVDNNNIVVRNCAYVYLENKFEKVNRMSIDNYIDYADDLKYYISKSIDSSVRATEVIDKSIKTASNKCQHIKRFDKI